MRNKPALRVAAMRSEHRELVVCSGNRSESGRRHFKAEHSRASRRADRREISDTLVDLDDDVAAVYGWLTLAHVTRWFRDDSYGLDMSEHVDCGHCHRCIDCGDCGCIRKPLVASPLTASLSELARAA